MAPTAIRRSISITGLLFVDVKESIFVDLLGGSSSTTANGRPIDEASGARDSLSMIAEMSVVYA